MNFRKLLTYLTMGTAAAMPIATAQNPTILQGNYITNVFGNSNFVLNPNAQTNIANVTNATRSTTTPLVATSEFTLSLASGANATWTLRAFDGGMKGQNCEARFTYRGFATATTKAEIVQNSLVVASLTLTPTTDPRIASINFPCGDLVNATTFRIAQTTANMTGTNEIGGIYVGLATNQANVAQAETVVLAARSTTQSIPASTATTVLWNTEPLDALNEYDPATGLFTAKRAGYYSYDSAVLFDLATWGSGDYGNIQAVKNTTIVEISGEYYPNRSYFMNLRISGTVYLNVGDTFKIQLFNSSAAAKPIVANDAWNFLTIKRFPSSSELVVKPETQNTWGGVQYRGAGGGLGNAVHAGSAAPTGYSAFNNAMWNQPTMLKGKASLATSSNNDLGFSISNLPVGNYQLSISGFLAANVGAGAGAGTRVRCNFRLRETTTSTVIAQQSIQNYAATAGAGTVDTRDYPNSVNGVFSNTSVATRNFILEAQKFSDTGTAGSCEVWSDNTANTLNTDIFLILTPLDQPSNSALYVQGPVLGAQTGAAISAGYVGEVLTTEDNADVNATSATYRTITLNVTPGVWEVQSTCLWKVNTAVMTARNINTSITNQNNNPSELVLGYFGPGTTAISEMNLVSPITRVRWDGTTNITEGSTNQSSAAIYSRCYPGAWSSGQATIRQKIKAIRIN